jgi:hypothetical protein
VRRSRVFSTLRLRCSFVVAAALAFWAPAQAQAPSSHEPAAPTVQAAVDDPSPPAPTGASALERARAAWDKGDYDIAEPLYREAVETGGLAANDVLDAYIHLGATRSVLGKKALALAAFKSAAVIDPHFVVPSEAGKRAAQTADQARRTVGRAGAIALSADFPSEVGAGDAAQVDATLDAAHLGAAPRMALTAHDPLSGKSWNDVEDSARTVHFKVPSSLALPGATLMLRVDALDRHQNHLASVEGKVHVRGAAPAAPVVMGPGAAGLSGTFSGAGVALATPGGAVASRSPTADTGTRKRGFWSTAWPWVIGGAALAAGGVAIYFAVRPTDDVNVGAPHFAVSN